MHFTSPYIFIYLVIMILILATIVLVFPFLCLSIIPIFDTIHFDVRKEYQINA